MVKVTSGQQGGLEESPLSDDERALLERRRGGSFTGEPGPVFDRGLEDTRTEDTEVIVEKLGEYLGEIKAAARVAKAQFGKSFGGQSAESDNQFVIDRIFHGYFGFDGWDDVTSYTSGGTNNWIDESNPANLSGSGGNAVTIGEPVVHLITGIGSYETSPGTSRVRFTLNDVQKTAINVEEEFRNTDLQMKWLDAPILLQEEDEVLVETYAVSGTDELFLEGVTFIENRDARRLDPVNIATSGSTDTTSVISQ